MFADADRCAKLMPCQVVTRSINSFHPAFGESFRVAMLGGMFAVCIYTCIYIYIYVCACVHRYPYYRNVQIFKHMRAGTRAQLAHMHVRTNGWNIEPNTYVVLLKNHLAHQNNICMVAERSQDLPSACACDLSLRSPPSPALSAMFATAENVVRPGTMNMENEDVAITIVDTATMFKLMVGSTLLLEKYVVNRWKKYSSMPIYLEGPPILDSPGSFLEMDSPGSRLAGALALYDRHRGVAQEDAPRQQGQLFLKQVKRQEENFKEKLVQLQHDYNVQLQRTKIGMGNKDQANNNEICDLRQELQQYQATILEHNKMIDEITDHDN